ncbi:hypothetical protein PSYAC_27768 [Pseudomonas syringae pv. actinidiae str. M302091]|nr:hypothetical protein PSYAC_27768 [Pseudomonas syringae pv. actinidiae str. M302091]
MPHALKARTGEQLQSPRLKAGDLPLIKPRWVLCAAGIQGKAL